MVKLNRYLKCFISSNNIVEIKSLLETPWNESIH